MRFTHLLTAAAAAALLASPLAAQVNITGTQTNVNTWFGDYRTNFLFNGPTDANPVTVTGSVNISGLDVAGIAGENSFLGVGLISKAYYDTRVAAGFTPGTCNFCGYARDIFGTFRYRGNEGFNAAIGGRTGAGSNESSLTTFAPAPTALADGILGNGDFLISFGTSGMSLTIGGSTITQAYAAGPSYTTDWSQGAYAFVGMFASTAGSSSTFDVTFNGNGTSTAVPEPGTLALLGVGLLGVVAARRVRGRHVSATTSMA